MAAAATATMTMMTLMPMMTIIALRPMTARLAMTPLVDDDDDADAVHADDHGYAQCPKRDSAAKHSEGQGH
eukprot:1268798-Pyramimonas_sp.AAC.1